MSELPARAAGSHLWMLLAHPGGALLYGGGRPETDHGLVNRDQLAVLWHGP